MILYRYVHCEESEAYNYVQCKQILIVGDSESLYILSVSNNSKLPFHTARNDIDAMFISDRHIVSLSLDFR